MPPENDPSETEPEPDEPETPNPTPEPSSNPSDDRLPDDHPAVKALSKANAEARDLRLKLKEFEDRDKSDLQKITDERDEERTRAARAEAEVAKLKAAIEHGLTRDDLDLRGAGDPEQITDRAKRLAERLKATAPSETDQPRPDPTQGVPAGDPASLDAQIAEAQAKGDVKAVVRLNNQKLAQASAGA